jgi:hypothetical protein
VVPPRVCGPIAFISGCSSASIIVESPMRISAWAMRPSGAGKRMISSAPNAFL